MKKLQAFLLSALSMLIILAACNGGGSKDAYILKMRLAKGDTFQNNMKIDMDMAMNMAAMKMNMKMKMDMGSRFEVLDSSTQGKQLKMTYTFMKMSMDMGQANPGIDTDSILNEATKGIADKSLLLTVKDNEVVDVKGLDSMTITNADPAARAMMEKMFTKESMNQTFGMMFNLYPDKPVKVGDSWEKENDIEMGMMKMKVKTTYTLTGVKNGIAELTMNGTLGSKGTMNQQGTNIDMDMKGSQKGRINVKLETGYIDNGNYDMDITADMDAMGQKIPMTIKGKYSITGNK